MAPGPELRSSKSAHGRPPHFRERNKLHYRLAHWPIWIFVFFIAPGPLTFDLIERGFDSRIGLWLAIVLIATGTAGLFGQLPGVEPKPYILRFTEDKPNLLYRRICYTMAWSDLISLTGMNLAGLVYALISGEWRLKQIYDVAYFPLAGAIILCGLAGWLPRVKPSTKGEGTERRYFYGTVWAVAIAQPALGLMWKLDPHSDPRNPAKLIVFAGILIGVGYMAWRGMLPRTRPIVPGEWAISD